jgi:hypothetical protein
MMKELYADHATAIVIPLSEESTIFIMLSENLLFPITFNNFNKAPTLPYLSSASLWFWGGQIETKKKI